MVLLIIEFLALLRLGFVPHQSVVILTLTACSLVPFGRLLLLVILIGISTTLNDDKIRKLEKIKTYWVEKHHSLVHYLKMLSHEFKVILELVK